MKMDLIRRCGLFFIAGALTASSLELPLTNPRAPFAQERGRDSGKTEKAKPFLDEKGKIFHFGKKAVQVSPSGFIRLMDSGREIAFIYFYGSSPYSGYFDSGIRGMQSPVPYSYDKKHPSVASFTADLKSKSVTVKGAVPFHKKDGKELLFDYSQTVRLTPENKIFIRLEYDRPENMKNARLGMICMSPRAKTFVQDGKTQTFEGKKWFRLEKQLPVQIEGAVKSDTFSLDYLTKNSMFVTSAKSFFFTVKKEKTFSGKIRFALELELDPMSWNGKKTSDGSVDLMEVEALKTENRVTRNLMPNPCLARGLNYFGVYENYALWRGYGSVILSRENPKFGEYCLQVPVFPDKTIDAAILSAAAGIYTASVYARANKPGASLHFTMGGHNRRKIYGTKIFKGKISTEWKRFQVTFTVPAPTALRYSCRVTAKEKDTLVYLDGFQLEKGSTATDFTASPVSARLLTSAPDDFIRHGGPVKARMKLSSLKGKASGTMTVTVHNMFGEELARSKHQFDFASGEHPEIPLDLEGKIPDGVHTVQTDFECNGMRYTEFSRFSIMPFFRNRHKLKNMFSLDYSGQRCMEHVEPGMEELIRRWMYIGTGCVTHCKYPAPEVDALCRKYNFEYLDSHLFAKTYPAVPNSVRKLKKMMPGADLQPGHSYYYFRFAENWPEHQFRHGPQQVLLLDHRLCGGWTPEYRKKVVDTTMKIVRKSSPRRIYIAGSEAVAEIKDDPHYVDLILAVREGVKKVYPEALFGEGGPYNMTIGVGIKEIDDMLTRLQGKMPIEIVHTHTYTHDVPAIERNFKALVDVVENKHGLKGMKYYFGEGMHWGPYQVLEWGLESLNWDARGWNTAVPFSYDMGWTEKLGAAWFMRSWLFFMTKLNQVISSSSSMYARAGTFDVDVQMRPRLGQKVPNTLSMLLGNAKDFVKDVSFAKNVKCLIWEDEKGRPVAAVWNQEHEVDRGLKQGPWGKADLPRDVEIFDMMGGKRIHREDGKFPLSPFPLFFRGKPGEVDRYVKILSHADVIGENTVPFSLDVRLRSRTGAQLNVENLTVRNEKIELTLNGKTESAVLKPLDTTSFLTELPMPIPFERVVESGIQYTIRTKGKTVSSSEKFHGIAVKHFKGNWDEIPAVPFNKTNVKAELSPQDFSAVWQMAWDKQNLHIRITVADDKFFCKAAAKPEQGWNNDTLQIFIDAGCNARRKPVNAFDQDDYVYNIYPSADGGSARVFRWRSPDQQLTLGLAAPKDKTFADDIPCKFTRTGSGYIYEITIPAKYILPAHLEENCTIGIAMALNDRDGEKQPNKTLATTPQGTFPFNRPYLYPQIILSGD